MRLNELKNNILDNSITLNTSLVFKYEDNRFLVDYYIDEIAKGLNLEKYYLHTVSEIKSLNEDSLFNDNNSHLYICNIDELSNIEVEDIGNTHNLIIVSSKINSNIEKELLKKDMLVKFDKLKDWQVQEFMRVRCPGLEESMISWLYHICNGDIYRIDNEISKLEIFSNSEQKKAFSLSNELGGFSDLCDQTIFNFINAIVEKNMNKIYNILVDINNIDIEPYGLLTLLHKYFRIIISIQMNSKVTSSSLNLSDRQFNMYKNYVGKYSGNQLINIFEFLSTIDYMIKDGRLDLTKDEQISYILCNLLCISEK